MEKELITYKRSNNEREPEQVVKRKSSKGVMETSPGKRKLLRPSGLGGGGERAAMAQAGGLAPSLMRNAK